MKWFDLKRLVLSGLLTAMTAIAAFMKIPMLPVPMSLQTFFVLLAGCLLGAGYGSLSQLTYLLLGLIGLPVFAGGGGLMYILQPTFGYLLAFPIAAWTVGKLFALNQRRGLFGFLRLELLQLMFINLIGVLIIFIIGVAYLYANLTFITGKGISIDKAIVSGAMIFLPGDLIKIFLVSVLTRKLRKLALLDLH
jgi:biotin transport system substrate-specific component